MDLPRSRSAEEAVTNILYNTPPPSLQPYKKCVVLKAIFSLGLPLELFFLLIKVVANEPRYLDMYSIVSYRTSLVCYRAYLGSLQAADSTSTRSSYVAPRYET